jgi:hypothetical protein
LAHHVAVAATKEDTEDAAAVAVAGLDNDVCGVCCGDGFVDFCAASNYGGCFVEGYGDAVEVGEVDEDEIIFLGKRSPSVSAVLS